MFISADLDWMDYVAGKKLIKHDTRVNLLGNRLVLIAPKDSKIDNVDDRPGLRPRQARRRRPHRDGRRQAVPAGKYGKAALEKLGVWDGVGAEARQAENVRAALALVARGEAPLGIVYETDAKVEPNVKIVGAFPDDSHPPIVYPVARDRDGASPRRRAISRSCARGAAKAMFEKHGFTFLVKPTS